MNFYLYNLFLQIFSLQVDDDDNEKIISKIDKNLSNVKLDAPAPSPIVYDNIVVGADGVGYVWTFRGNKSIFTLYILYVTFYVWHFTIFYYFLNFFQFNFFFVIFHILIRFCLCASFTIFLIFCVIECLMEVIVQFSCILLFLFFFKSFFSDKYTCDERRCVLYVSLHTFLCCMKTDKEEKEEEVIEEQPYKFCRKLLFLRGTKY